MFGWLFGSKETKTEDELISPRDNLTMPLVSIEIFTDGTINRDNVGIDTVIYSEAKHPELFAAVKDFVFSLPNEALEATSRKRMGVERSKIVNIITSNLTVAQGRYLRTLTDPVMSKRATKERIKSNQILDALRAERK